MSAVGAVFLVAVLLIVLALVYFLVSTIVALRKITAGLDTVIERRRRDRREERAGRGGRDRHQRAARRGRGAARGPARQEGRDDRRDGPGRGPLPGRRQRPGCAPSPRAPTCAPPRIGEVYTKGTLTLARLGREAPIAALSPSGAVLRNVEGGSLAARLLYPSVRHQAPERLPVSPVIGTDAPEQYERREDIGAPRKRMPSES